MGPAPGNFQMIRNGNGEHTVPSSPWPVAVDRDWWSTQITIITMVMLSSPGV